MVKTNKAMRVASGLLVLTLASTCMISGTFAKYTTNGIGEDTARVAKFGVEVTANGSTFAQSYNEKGSVTVQSDEDVVAPGTSGEMATMALKGTPETSVKVSYAGEFSLGDASTWEVGSDFYCPLVVTVKGTNGTTTIKQTDTVATQKAFEAAVNNAIAAYSKTYVPGTDLSGVGDDSLTVTWAWPFGNDDGQASDNDTKDTALGNAAAEGKAAKVTLKVTTTVTQID